MPNRSICIKCYADLSGNLIKDLTTLRTGNVWACPAEGAYLGGVVADENPPYGCFKMLEQAVEDSLLRSLRNTNDR